MRKRQYLLLLLLSMVIPLSKAGNFGYDFYGKINGVYYGIVEYSDNTAEVVSKTMNWDDYGNTFTNDYSGNITISPTIKVTSSFFGTQSYTVNSIHQYAFCNYDGYDYVRTATGSTITSVDIPSTITSIGESAFRQCTKLSSITCRVVTPITIASSVFEGVNKKTCTLYVPANSVAAYKQKAVWKEFYNIEAIPVAATSVTLDKTTASMVTGETLTLKATVKPDGATNKKVTWKSSNTAVATVDANGKVTAVAAGTATITVTTADGSNKTATCKVTVTALKVKTITLNETLLLLEEGETSSLTATILPANATNKAVTWKSSNTAVATVDANGKVTAVAAGSAVVTATAADGSGAKASCVAAVTLPASATHAAGEYALEVTGGNIVSGLVNEPSELPVRLRSNFDIKSFSFTIALPERIEFEYSSDLANIHLTERLDGILVDATRNADGSITLTGAATDDKVIAAGDASHINQHMVVYPLNLDDNGIVTAVNEVGSKAIAGTEYYDVNGVKLTEPKSGVNIVVTTYSDGTRTTAKVVK